MLRQLLTLLAVISGFTLAAEPVSAAEADVVSIASLGENADCQPVVAAPLQFWGWWQSSTTTDPQPCVEPPVVVAAPTVQLQVDRARE